MLGIPKNLMPVNDPRWSYAQNLDRVRLRLKHLELLSEEEEKSLLAATTAAFRNKLEGLDKDV